MKLKPWFFLAATGVALTVLYWGLAVYERGQERPLPVVPYSLVALPILFITGTVLAVRRRRKG